MKKAKPGWRVFVYDGATCANCSGQFVYHEIVKALESVDLVDGREIVKD